MRKFVIGFVSLCVVLGAFLLYNRLSSSPSIDTGPEVDIIRAAADTNAVGFDSEVGRIGDVSLGPVRKAKYITLNEDKEVEREFGFEKLLSESRDIWDIEKPYMNIFRRNFKCYVTADKGKVQVETAIGRTTPKDATFSSNVVVRIISGPPDDLRESFVYLDSIVFLSDRSLLSTSGPVVFVSEDIRLDGTGMELIYNEQTERLEYFKITDLETLSIKGSSASMFSRDKAREEAPSEAVRDVTSQQPEESPVAVDTPKAEAPVPDTQPPAVQKEGVYYKCTFSKNVLVNTPEELIFAGDTLCINDIFWSKASAGSSEDAEAGAADEVETAVEPAGQDRQLADSAGEPDVAVAAAESSEPNEPAEPNAPAGQFQNVVVTCDGGFVVVPRDSARAQEDSPVDEVEEGQSVAAVPDEFNNDTEKNRFFTRRIDYNVTTGDGVADGLSELTFYVGSASDADSNEPPVPVKVTAREGADFSHTSNNVVFKGDCLVTMPQSGLTETKNVTFIASEIIVSLPEDRSSKPDMFAAGPAKLVFYMEDANSTHMNQGPVPVTVDAQKQARFLAASNQIIFEGDSRCIMLREDPNVVVEYMLLSEQITVDLPADTNDGLSGPAAGIKHLTATGDVVRLATTKTAKAGGAFADQIQDGNTKKLLGGVELKCRRFDYDAVRQEILATGPGVIKLNNSKAPEPNEPAGRFSLQNPCWAIMDGFDTLTYLIRENKIVADAGSQEKLRMDYIPAVNGRYDELISIKTSHVEFLLHELPTGRMELLSLTAKGGIEYIDKDNEFIGSELSYDHQTAIVKVSGDESQPCYYNGVLVGGIEMDARTRRVEAEIIGPGAIRINR